MLRLIREPSLSFPSVPNRYVLAVRCETSGCVGGRVGWVMILVSAYVVIEIGCTLAYDRMKLE
eukprot:SAG11_NODE_16864_length_535_cov_0.591743_2_plen_62_part_01